MHVHVFEPCCHRRLPPPTSPCLAVRPDRKVDATSFTTSEGPPCAYLGCPHPQAFLDASVGATVAPVWHLGPCILVTEAVELAPLMFALGPEYAGVWTAESPLEAISSANAADVLRRLQVCICFCLIRSLFSVGRDGCVHTCADASALSLSVPIRLWAPHDAFYLTPSCLSRCI